MYSRREAIQKSVSWLFKMQRSNGSWENAAWKTAFVTHVIIESKAERENKKLVNAINWLVDTQNNNGSWEDDLWTTAVTIKALIQGTRKLHDLKINNRNVLEKAFTWIEMQCEDEWKQQLESADFGPAFPAQAMSAFLRYDLTKKQMRYIKQIIEYLLKEQEIDGSWYDDLRHTSQVVISLLEAGLPTDHDAISHAYAWIKSKQLKDGSWRGEIPQTANAILGGIYIAMDCKPKFLDAGVRWLLSKQLNDGSWVKDVRFTAWSLYSLSIIDRIPDLFEGIKRPELKIPKINRIYSIDASKDKIDTLSVFAIADNRYAYLLESSQYKKNLEFISNLDNRIKDNLTKKLDRVSAIALTLYSQCRGEKRVRGVSDNNIIKDITPRHIELVEDLKKNCLFLYRYMLPPKTQKILSQSKPSHLLLELDKSLMGIPWELLYDKDNFLCLKHAIGRTFIADERFIHPSRRIKNRFTILLVGDPTGNLPDAKEEINKLESYLTDMPNLEIAKYIGKDISKVDFLDMVGSGDFDIVHFAGHATFNYENSENSYLEFSDGSLYIDEIVRFLDVPPAIVFMNACSSGKIQETAQIFESDLGGMPITFTKAGADVFVGSIFPVDDSAAALLASIFYKYVISGKTVGLALRNARLELYNRFGPLNMGWGSFVLYGNPTFKLF